MVSSNFDHSNISIIYIKHELKPSENEQKDQEIDIEAPLLCPVCGSKEVVEKAKVYADFNYEKYLKLWVCEKHITRYGVFHKEHLKFIFIILVFIIFFFSSIDLSLTLFLIISFSIVYIITEIINVYVIKKDTVINYIYPTLEFHDSRSVIFIEDNSYAEEFIKLNEERCYRIYGDFTNYRLILKKLVIHRNFLSILTFIPFGLLFYSIINLNLRIIALISFIPYLLIFYISFQLRDKIINQANKIKNKLLRLPEVINDFEKMS